MIPILIEYPFDIVDGRKGCRVIKRTEERKKKPSASLGKCNSNWNKLFFVLFIFFQNQSSD